MTDRWHETRARGSVGRERVTQRRMEAGPATATQTRVGMTQGPSVTPWALYLMSENWGWAAENAGGSHTADNGASGSMSWEAGWSRMAAKPARAVVIRAVLSVEGRGTSSGAGEGGAGVHLTFLA